MQHLKHRESRRLCDGNSVTSIKFCIKLLESQVFANVMAKWYGRRLIVN